MDCQGHLKPLLQRLREPQGMGRGTNPSDCPPGISGSLLSRNLYTPLPPFTVKPKPPIPVPPPDDPTPTPPEPLPPIEPIFPPKPRPNMTQYARLLEAYDAGIDLPTLTGYEFDDLKAELLADEEISAFDRKEILEAGRFFGHGFGVDYTDYIAPTPEPEVTPEQPPVEVEPVTEPEPVADPEIKE